MSKVASTIRLDRELREEAEKELNQMGLTLTAYLIGNPKRSAF